MKKRELFRPSMTVEQADSKYAEMNKYRGNVNAITLDSYLTVVGVSDLLMRAAYRGATARDVATKDEWDEIFKKAGLSQ